MKVLFFLCAIAACASTIQEETPKSYITIVPPQGARVPKNEKPEEPQVLNPEFIYGGI